MPERVEGDIERRVERILAGDSQAVSRAITSVESRDAASRDLLKKLFPHTGHARIIGITGAGGSGKSTLVDGLISALRKRGKTVGVLALDPSSPFTGGAILGDRIRMHGHTGDPGTYIRSMATRGSLGGLSRATMDAALVLDASGKEFILVETVGVGQDEVEVARLADITLVLLVPGLGDDVQAFKAGVMEIADIFVINKSELPGADRIEQEVSALLGLAASFEGWQPRIVRTVATRRDGIEELLETVFAYLEFSERNGARAQRQAGHWRARLLELLRENLLQQVMQEFLRDGELDQHVSSIASRAEDPYSVVDRILNRAGRHDRTHEKSDG